MNSTAVTLRSQQCCCSIWRQAAIYWEQNLQQKGLELVDEYYRVIRSLPAWLAHPLEQLPSELACSIHELRFRTDQRISLTMSGMPLLLGELPECPASLRALRLTALQMEEILYALCGGSVHTHQTELAQGYVTAVGGCRAGIAGRFVVRNGQLVLQKITSVNFRIARNIPIFLPPELCNVLRTGNFAGLLIAGEPGSGKTTLLKIITGQLQPLKGTLIQANFTYVYLNQEYSIINDRNSILEQAYAFNGRNLPEHEIKIILNRYLFPASEWDKSCRKLSGGEKMRLAFCCLMISNNMPDMFILDEPTNNLDIQSIEIITATIKNYAGTVIAISHDNYFIQEIGVEQSIFLS